MPKALIAGGGIAGTAAALALARAGWQITVFERRPELGEIGAGLQVSPNAARVLDWLGVLDAVRGSAFVPHSGVLRDGRTGAEIYRAALADAARDRWGAPYLHLHRADLLSVLVNAARAAGVHLEIGCAVERTVEHPGHIALHMADGAIHEADLVLGADGIHSALRKAVLPDEAPRFTGQVAWRGLVPADAVPEGTIPPDATVWAGEGRHLVTYYLRGGALINFVAVEERDDWTEESWSAPGDPDALRACFQDWHAAPKTLLNAVGECFLWGLFDRPEQVRWTQGRLALIGDAAHPMLPFMAQGAAMALEDVAVLVRHLGAAEISEALSLWEDERWPRVIRVLQQARANGRMFHRAPGAMRAASRAVVGTVSKLAPGLAAGQLDWLYGFDPVAG